MKSSDFQVYSRQITLNRHIQKREEIWTIVWQLINELWDETTPIRLLAVTVSGLENQNEVYKQMTLADFSTSSKQTVVDDKKQTKDSAKQEKIKNLVFELNQQMGGNFLKLGKNK